MHEESESVYDETSPHYEKAIFHLGIPILGICYGSQLMAWTLGGEVATALLSRAIGKQLTCVFVDHGLMRKNEGDEIEEKRKIIGTEFYRVFWDEIKKHQTDGLSYFAQGTIYPDRIESGKGKNGKSDTIKTHHNMVDHRTYTDLIAIRAVTTDDFMTADWAKIPYEILGKVSGRITNEMKGIVNRVVYDITSKPPGTVEFE